LIVVAELTAQESGDNDHSATKLARRRSPMRRHRCWLAGPVAAAVVILGATAAPLEAAETRFGIHAGVWTDDGDPLVGGDVVLSLHEPRWTLNPSLEYVSGDRVDRWILNGDALYDLDLDTRADVWVGGGLVILFSDHDRGGSSTDLGLNLLAGAGLDTSSGLFPYVQGKAVITDDSSFALVLGLRF
jgi:hypothetical protein